MPTTLAPREVVINLPSLHGGKDGNGGQIEVENCTARFIICFCGRRWGKTTLGVYKCIKGSINLPGIYWWVGPNYPNIQASQAWPLLKTLVRQIPDCEIREADRCVIFPNGSEIWIKSADSPDSLRGPKLRGVVLDEMAQIKEEAWTAVLRPALTDLKGWALFIGTPKGKNWVYRLYQNAATRPGWARFKKFTVDNPYIDPEEVEAAKLDMSPEQFKQEYEAEFGASQYLVFPEFDRTIHAWPGEIPEFESFWGGLDFGGTTTVAHKSAGVVAGRTRRDELILLAEFEQSGPGVGERQLYWMGELSSTLLKARQFQNKKYTPILWKADKTQMWGIQLVRQAGYPIFPSKGGKDSIEEGIELVHRRLTVRDIDQKPRLYYLPTLTRVPLAFERYRNYEPNEDSPTPSKPISVNDDLITSIRYLVEGIDLQVLGDPSKLYPNLLARVV